jgi:hypothetical protein
MSNNNYTISNQIPLLNRGLNFNQPIFPCLHRLIAEKTNKNPVYDFDK